MNRTASIATAPSFQATIIDEQGPNEECSVQDQSVKMYDRMIVQGQNFWAAVRAPFLDREVTRGDVRRTIEFGLQLIGGGEGELLELFNLPARDRKKFLAFLTKYQLLPALPFLA